MFEPYSGPMVRERQAVADPGDPRATAAVDVLDVDSRCEKVNALGNDEVVLEMEDVVASRRRHAAVGVRAVTDEVVPDVHVGSETPIC
jgi:hypothetical protein